ncbi:protein kinase [Lipomyces kononenkoae]|uniref:Protein kinase n=1 Tax=Lipomyces kononenkoae TaxID=34357 RepID=A0ACC3SV51_LIPKO
MATRPSAFVFQPSSLDNIEQIENYRSGGFHPVSIGDSFSRGRYRVLHKLGLEDSQLSEASNICNELRILQYLNDSTKYYPACEHILSLLDYFTIDGPNGFHACLVSPFVGPDLAQISYTPGRRAGSRRLRGGLARKFATQVTQAVAYMHNRGVAHGDLNTSNILIQLANVNSWSDKFVYERLGFPVMDKVLLWSGEPNESLSAPEHLVEPANLSDLEYNCIEEKVVLVDFGQSFMLQTPPPPNEVGFTMSYCAPEVYFERKMSVWSDIWSLGCTIFEMRAGRQLFESFLGGPHEVLLQVVQIIGKLPEPWWRSWDKRHVYFDDDGKPKKYRLNNTDLSTEQPIIQQIQDIGSPDNEADADEAAAGTTILPGYAPAEPETESIFEPMGVRLSETEVEVFGDLLQRAIRYNPEERLQTKDILKHPWFTTSFEDARSCTDCDV